MDEIISTSIAYESKNGFKNAIASENGCSDLICCSNLFGLVIVVAQNKLLIYNTKQIENSKENMPLEISVRESIKGVYLSPSELYLCIRFDNHVSVIELSQLFAQVTFLLSL